MKSAALLFEDSGFLVCDIATQGERLCKLLKTLPSFEALAIYTSTVGKMWDP